MISSPNSSGTMHFLSQVLKSKQTANQINVNKQKSTKSTIKKYVSTTYHLLGVSEDCFEGSQHALTTSSGLSKIPVERYLARSPCHPPPLTPPSKQ